MKGSLTDNDFEDMLKLMMAQKETLKVLQGSLSDSARQLAVMDMELTNY